MTGTITGFLTFFKLLKTSILCTFLAIASGASEWWFGLPDTLHAVLSLGLNDIVFKPFIVDTLGLEYLERTFSASLGAFVGAFPVVLFIIPRIWPDFPDILAAKLYSKSDEDYDWEPTNTKSVLLGRDDELRILNRFAGHKAQSARWMSITAPHGYGKSRLAVEWLRVRRENGWDAGFLAPDCTLKDIKKVIFRSKTAIVIDEASLKKDLKSVLAALLLKATSSRQVCILLVDQTRPDFGSEQPNKTLDSAIERARYLDSQIDNSDLNSNLVLLPLSDDLLKSINPVITDYELERASGRPLYALSGIEKKMQSYVELLINRAGDGQDNLNALALAALTGGAKISELELNDIQLPRKDTLRKIFGEDSVKSNILPALRPEPVADKILLYWATQFAGRAELTKIMVIAVNHGEIEPDRRLSSLFDLSDLNDDEQYARQKLDQIFLNLASEWLKNRRDQYISEIKAIRDDAISRIDTELAKKNKSEIDRYEIISIFQKSFDLLSNYRNNIYSKHFLDLQILDSYLNIINKYNSSIYNESSLLKISKYINEIIYEYCYNDFNFGNDSTRILYMKACSKSLFLLSEVSKYSNKNEMSRALSEDIGRLALIIFENIESEINDHHIHNITYAINMIIKSYSLCRDINFEKNIDYWSGILKEIKIKNNNFANNIYYLRNYYRGVGNKLNFYMNLEHKDNEKVLDFEFIILNLLEKDHILNDRYIFEHCIRSVANIMYFYARRFDEKYYIKIKFWGKILHKIAEKEEYQKNSDIKFHYVRGCSQSIYFYSDNGVKYINHMEIWANRCLFIIKSGILNHRSDANFELASAFVSAMYGYQKLGREYHHRLEFWGRKLVEIAGNPYWHRDEKIQEQYAQGAVNAIVARSTDSILWLGRLKQIKENWPGNSKILKLANSVGA